MTTAFIGQPVSRIDGRRKVTGKATYAAEFDQVDEAGVDGEEDLALAGHPHQWQVLVGQQLLQELADAAGTLVGEGHPPLVGHHGALDREHVRSERDAQHLRVLEGEPRLAGDLEVRLVEQAALHDHQRRIPPPSPPQVPASAGCP